ncbi:MAG: acyltransferase [Planctomycetaceae bacterium]|nr:acyltransferase [Planctomycetaceae bacterium]
MPFENTSPSQHNSATVQPLYERVGSIDSLTSMRFFAALIVVIWHYFDPPNPESPLAKLISAVAPWTHRGHLMVDFFFVLSGFVLTYVYFESVRRQRFDISEFYVKRFARIYPMHLLTFLAFVLIWLVASSINFASSEPLPLFHDALAHLMLIHAWGVSSRGTFNIPSWSVSAEWFAYLLFPLLVFAIARVRVAACVVTTVVMLICAATLAPLAGRELTHRTFDFGILRILFEFPFGMAICLVYLLINKGPWRWIYYLSLLVVIVCLSIDIPEVVTVIAFGVLILASAIAEHQGCTTLLKNRWLVYGGEISFSIYMLHAVFWIPCVSVGLRALSVARDSMTADLIKCVTIVVLIVASHYSFEWIEKPAREIILAAYRRRDRVGQVAKVDP